MEKFKKYIVDELGLDESGVSDARKSLEENKERFLNEFMSSFDTFYKVVMMFK